jgi:hypothetical protein
MLLAWWVAGLDNRGQSATLRLLPSYDCALNIGESDTIKREMALRQELAMHKIEIRGFKNGQWTEAKAPEWFDRATDTDEAWTDAFKDYRVTLINEFDCGDSIQIYRAENGSYCVVFRDTFQALAVVFIETTLDYIQFCAQVIAPTAHDGEQPTGRVGSGFAGWADSGLGRSGEFPRLSGLARISRLHVGSNPVAGWRFPTIREAR